MRYSILFSIILSPFFAHAGDGCRGDSYFGLFGTQAACPSAVTIPEEKFCNPGPEAEAKIAALAKAVNEVKPIPRNLLQDVSDDCKKVITNSAIGAYSHYVRPNEARICNSTQLSMLRECETQTLCSNYARQGAFLLGSTLAAYAVYTNTSTLSQAICSAIKHNSINPTTISNCAKAVSACGGLLYTVKAAGAFSHLYLASLKLRVAQHNRKFLFSNGGCVTVDNGSSEYTINQEQGIYKEIAQKQNFPINTFHIRRVVPQVNETDAKFNVADNPACLTINRPDNNSKDVAHRFVMEGDKCTPASKFNRKDLPLFILSSSAFFKFLLRPDVTFQHVDKELSTPGALELLDDQPVDSVVGIDEPNLVVYKGKAYRHRPLSLEKKVCSPPHVWDEMRSYQANINGDTVQVDFKCDKLSSQDDTSSAMPQSRFNYLQTSHFDKKSSKKDYNDIFPIKNGLFKKCTLANQCGKNTVSYSATSDTYNPALTDEGNRPPYTYLSPWDEDDDW